MSSFFLSLIAMGQALHNSHPLRERALQQNTLWRWSTAQRDNALRRTEQPGGDRAPRSGITHSVVRSSPAATEHRPPQAGKPSTTEHPLAVNDIATGNEIHRIGFVFFRVNSCFFVVENVLFCSVPPV
jgi:hypothetical protein